MQETWGDTDSLIPCNPSSWLNLNLQQCPCKGSCAESTSLLAEDHNVFYPTLFFSCMETKSTGRADRKQGHRAHLALTGVGSQSSALPPCVWCTHCQEELGSVWVGFKPLTYPACARGLLLAPSYSPDLLFSNSFCKKRKLRPHPHHLNDLNPYFLSSFKQKVGNVPSALDLNCPSAEDASALELQLFPT